jgi:hypothetical protein
MAALENDHGRVTGSLFRRIGVLVGLIEHIEPHHPRRASLDAILRRMRLFSRMTEKLGLAPPRTAFSVAVHRVAELGCMECTEERRCRHWLDGKWPADDPREFCSSQPLFDTLPRASSEKS